MKRAQIRVVFKTTKDAGIVQPSITKDSKKTLDDIKKDDKYIDKISDPYENKQMNKDKTTAFADITLKRRTKNGEDRFQRLSR